MNILTDLYPLLYAAMQVVSREQTGMIAAVQRNSTADQAAIGQFVTVPIVPIATTRDITPSNIRTTGEAMDVDNVQVQLTKQKESSFFLTGEDYKKLMSSGTLSDVTMQRMLQCFRALVNEMETDLSNEALIGCSRSYGTPGTTPFGTADNLTDITQLAAILDEHGAPMTGRSLVLDNIVMANLQGRQPSTFRVNESGDSGTRRFGSMGMLFGFDLGKGIFLPTYNQSSTALAATINNSGGYEKGATRLTVDNVANGEGQNAGAIINIAGAPGDYVLAEDLANSGTTIVINEPGLTADVADNAAVTTKNTSNHTTSIAMTMDALVLVCRPPANPPDGDAGDHISLVDPVSNLAFDVGYYKQYRQTTVEISMAWGVKTINSRHMIKLAG